MTEETTPEFTARLHEASTLADQGRVDEALEILQEEEAAHPTDPTLLCMLGVITEEIPTMSGLAYEYYRRSLAGEPVDPAVLVTLGVGLARYDDPDAERVLRLAAVSAPTLATARLHYGAYLAREGLVEEALAELGSARELDDADPRVPRHLALAHLIAGRVTQALTELETALELADADPDLRVLYGLALLQQNRAEEAAEEIHRGSVALLEDGDVQLLTALACAGQEWWDEAWDAFARAEGAPVPAGSGLLREAEDALEAGAEAASVLLREQLAPAMMRERLMELD